MLTFEQVKKNPQINEFISRSKKYLESLGFTDHGFRHVNIVADRAAMLARELKFSPAEIETARVAGYCHDMGNFLGRTSHHYWGSILFHQVFGATSDHQQVVDVMQAIVAHDKDEVKVMNKIAAVTIIADKSDVDRSRVLESQKNDIQIDIHDRVNFAVVDNSLKVDKKNKVIKLTLKVDTKIMEVMEYFEIFTERMVYCRTAAKFLGYKFSLEINKFKLS